MISLTPAIEILMAPPAGFAQTWFRQVAGAAAYARIRPEALPLPAAWVVRSSDKSKHAGIGAEDVTVEFDVVIAVENVRLHSAGDTDDLLLQYRLAVKTLLLGWEVQPDTRPVKFSGGSVLEYTEGDIYWRDRYSFDALITNYLPDPPPFSELVYTGGGL